MSAALAILSAEYLCIYMTLAVYHDGPVLATLPGLWRVLSHGTKFAAITAVVIASLSIARTRTTPDAPAAQPEAPLPSRGSALVVHALSYVCCFALVISVFARARSLSLAVANASFVIWIASGTASLLGLYVWAKGKRLARPTWLTRPAIAFACGLATLAWVAAVNIRPIWVDLAPHTLRLCGWLLSFAFTDIVISKEQGNVIGTDEFAVRITNECSGLEGMGLIVVFLLGYLWRFRRELRFPRALLLLPISALVAYVLNALRIVALVSIGTWLSPEIAKGGFHSNAGWIFFSALAVGLSVVCHHWSFVSRLARASEADTLVHVESDDPTTAYLLPLVSMLAVGLITASFTESTLDRAYALRWLTAIAVLYAWRRHYPQLVISWSAYPFVIGAVISVMWVLLPAPDAPEVSRAIGMELDKLGSTSRALWLMLRFMGSAVVVPLAEELAFRGYLQRRLISQNWASVALSRITVPSVVVTSLAFGALHSNWIAGAFAGVAFSGASCLRGKLSDAVLAHGTANGLLCIWALATRNWAVL